MCHKLSFILVLAPPFLSTASRRWGDVSMLLLQERLWTSLGLRELPTSQSCSVGELTCNLGSVTIIGHLPNDQTPASCPWEVRFSHWAAPPSSSPIIVLICVRILAKIQGAHTTCTPPRHTDVLELKRLHGLVQLPHFSCEIHGPKRLAPPHVKHFLRACFVPGPESKSVTSRDHLHLALAFALKQTDLQKP